MPPPDSQEVKVAVDAMRGEAKIWDDSSGTLGQIPTRTEALRLTGIEAGLFAVVFDEYERAINTINDRVREGQQTMTQVATTLRSAADIYEQEDAAGEHRLRNLY